MSKKDFTEVTIKDTSERAEMIMNVFGRLTVPVVGILPRWVSLEGVEGLHKAYMLDLNAMSEGEKERLIDALADEFEAEKAVVLAYVLIHGLPILADHCQGVSTSKRFFD